MRTMAVVLLALAAVTARGAYDGECQRLAFQLARDPGVLTVGDIDALRSCLSQLQAAGMTGNAVLPPPRDDLCPPAAPAAACPACPSAAQLCPREPARREEPPRQRTYIPKY